MKRAIVIVGLVVVGLVGLLAGDGLAFDPPRIIGRITSPHHEQYFASDFSCIGDQNGDGKDDLILNEYLSNERLMIACIYQGAAQMSGDTAFTLRGYEPDLAVGGAFAYFGRVQPAFPPFVGVYSGYTVERSPQIRIDFHECAREMGNSPTFVQSNAQVVDGYRNRPCDFNGDGIPDIVLRRAGIGLQVIYGGDSLDTTGNWHVAVNAQQYSIGRDLNGDGCGDIVAYPCVSLDDPWFEVYLGGNPADTVPAIRFRPSSYNLRERFTQLPDINGDGFDEWGAYWWFIPDPGHPGREAEGFAIFLGGEVVDSIPDLFLAGTPDPYLGDGTLTGGDFNGDSYNDVVTMTGGPYDHGQAAELQIYLGNRWITADDNVLRPDIFVDLSRAYGGQLAQHDRGYLGAVGDYNGDDVDDFILDDISSAVIVFAGSRDWRVGVELEEHPTESNNLKLGVAPNPFNETVQIKYVQSNSSHATLSIYDIRGRQVWKANNTDNSPGEHHESVSLRESGIYIVVLQSEDQRIARKIVCIK